VPTLQVGFEWNPAANEFAPIATWIVLQQEGVRPTVFLGTSTDRIGSPEGTQTYYATASKAFDRLPVTLYGTVGYSEWDAEWKAPFGGYVEIAHGVSVQGMYDGERTHALAHYARERWNVSLIWAWLESAGLSVAVGW